MNDWGACVTSIATACATSSAFNILLGSCPACGLSSVSTEPGQITETRILWRRTSSATEYVKPFSPHFEAAYAAPFGRAFFPASEEMLMMCPDYERIMMGAKVRIA